MKDWPAQNERLKNPWQLPGAKAYLKLHVDQQKPYVAEYS